VYQDGLSRLVGEAQRLRRLVHELLDASRAERGQLLGAREPVDVVAVAREAAERRSDAAHDVQVLAEAPLVGELDQVRVGQLLDNLIENGVKYSPDGGQVSVRLWNEDGMIRISVTDRGIGVPMEDMPYLFERYHRGNNVDDRRFAGMGLGLFICRGIAEEHGGRIWAESNVGLGTTFHVAMPLVPPTGAVATPTSTSSLAS